MKMILSVCGLFFLISFSAFAGQVGYSGVIDDLPLMPGMIEKMEDSIVFDAPGGRIVEIGAETKANVAAVSEFYADALPALGWEPISSSGFIRDNEILKISSERKENITVVHFSLAPFSGGNL